MFENLTKGQFLVIDLKRGALDGFYTYKEHAIAVREGICESIGRQDLIVAQVVDDQKLGENGIGDEAWLHNKLRSELCTSHPA